MSTSISSSSPAIHSPYFRLVINHLISPSPSLRGARSQTPAASSSSEPVSPWKVVAANQIDMEDGVLPPDVAKATVNDYLAKFDDLRWAFFKETT
jgi:U3 small nucleolar RNA-associated protein 19